MEKVEIYQQQILGENGKVKGKMAILRGGLDSENPIAFMDNAVSKYVGNKPYNEFIEIHLDNPWVRVIISEIDELHFVPFENQTL